MSEKVFWRIAFFFPLLAPVAVLSYAALRSWLGAASSPGHLIQFILIGSLFFGGIQYLVFLVLLLIILWSKPVSWYRWASRLAPLLFLVVFLLGFQLYWLGTDAGSWVDSPRSLVGYSSLVLVLGYAYVAIAWLLRVALETLALID